MVLTSRQRRTKHPGVHTEGIARFTMLVWAAHTIAACAAGPSKQQQQLTVPTPHATNDLRRRVTDEAAWATKDVSPALLHRVPSQQPLPTCSTQTEESLQEFRAANIDGEEDHPVCDISNVRTPSPTASDAVPLTDGLEAARRSKDPQPSNTPSASEGVVDQAETSNVGADRMRNISAGLVGQHVCSKCGFFCTTFSLFAQHTRTVHNGTVTSFVCSMCGSNYFFLKHYQEHHRRCKIKHSESNKPWKAVHSDGEIIDRDVVRMSLEQQPNNYGIVSSVMLGLCRRLEGRHKCLKTCIDDVVQEVSNMFAVAEFPIDTANIKTDRLRKCCYENAGIYVPPTEVQLEGTKKAYIIKLDLLANLLKHPEIVTHVRNLRQSKHNSLLQDFCDGSRFRSQPIFQKQNIILLSLYYDDIELANHIGMKRGSRGILSTFYVSLLNLPPHERSKLSNIFLLGVGYTSHLKQHTARLEFFHNFTTVLKALNTEGMNFRTNRGTENFFGALMTLTGDALAVHSLAGFKESFGHAVFHSCRACLVQTADYAQPSRHGQCILRTERETIAQVEQLKESTCAAARSKLSKEFGIT
ncbi:uncharacterized protein [Dermacentor albipictus]|uniref:uncharacterized protein isoform X1 n=1 Tax=Dermacentor albipictus TaxID=60249 RepID=UPI0038FCCEE4